MKKAGHDLEGGFVSPFEGLAFSRRPCETALSVAGFLVSFRSLPGRGEVYSEGRIASFFPGRSPFLNLTGITVILRGVPVLGSMTSVLYTACTQAGTPTRVVQGGIYTRVYLSP